MLKTGLVLKPDKCKSPGDQTRKNTPTANQSAWFSESAMVENFFFKGE